MRVRKLGVLVAAVMVALGLYAPSAHAVVGPPVAVCIVAGQVSINPGVVINVPPSGTGGGGYGFFSIVLTCAGTVAGACPTTSSGSTFGDSPTSGFSGSFNANCLVTGQTCNGNIGGPALLNWQTAPPLPTPQLTNFPDGAWSFSAGPLLVASLTGVSCSNLLNTVPSLAGEGLFAAAAAPDPTSLNDGTCGTGSAGPTIVGVFCRIVVAGVAVLTV